MKIKSSVVNTRLPYYSSTGADFVRKVAQHVNEGKPFIVRGTEQNLITARLKWYNGLRYLRDVHPKQYCDLRVGSIKTKKYDDCVVFMSESNITMMTLLKHLSDFFKNAHLKDGDIFEATEVDLSVHEWNEIRAFLRKHNCTFDISEAEGRLLLINHNENNRDSTNAEPGEPNRCGTGGAAEAAHSTSAPCAHGEDEGHAGASATAP